MIEKQSGVVSYYQFERLSDSPAIVHAVSTRAATDVRSASPAKGGSKDPPLRTGPTRRRGTDRRATELNLSFLMAEEPRSVVVARERVCAAIGIDLDHLVVPRQVHGDHVALVDRSDRGRGARGRETAIPETDGLITKDKGVVLAIMAADCVPLLFYDPIQNAIGAAHAGWRGTVARIAAKTVAAMAARYGSEPSALIVGIGPSIGPCCYAVGEEVLRAAAAAFGPDAAKMVDGTGDRQQFDLWAANRHVLISAGVRDENIEVAGVCTACHVDRFFSHRAEAGRAGRFGAFIALRVEEK